MSRSSSANAGLAAALMLTVLACAPTSTTGPTPSNSVVVTPTPIAVHTPAQIIQSKWTLINFGAEWCPICKKLEPELAYFPVEQPNVTYVHVDVDHREAKAFKKYFPDYFKGRSIPLTVLIDPSGKAVKEWSGYHPYHQMVGDILAMSSDQSKGE